MFRFDRSGCWSLHTNNAKSVPSFTRPKFLLMFVCRLRFAVVKTVVLCSLFCRLDELADIPEFGYFVVCKTEDMDGGEVWTGWRQGDSGVDGDEVVIGESVMDGEGFIGEANVVFFHGLRREFRSSVKLGLWW